MKKTAKRLSLATVLTVLYQTAVMYSGTMVDAFTMTSPNLPR